MNIEIGPEDIEMPKTGIRAQACGACGEPLDEYAYRNCHTLLDCIRYLRNQIAALGRAKEPTQ